MVHLSRRDCRATRRAERVLAEPFLDPAQFRWTSLLEEHYPAIRTEAERMLRVRAALPNFQGLAPDWIRLTDDDQWKLFWFVGYGVWDNPELPALPDHGRRPAGHPGLITGFYSILGPRKRLPPHHGPYRGVLRHHLALIVPDPDACGIRVGNQTRHWHEGRSLVFDAPTSTKPGTIPTPNARTPVAHLASAMD